MDDDATYEQAWIDKEGDDRFDALLTPEDRCLLYVAGIECGVFLL